MPDFPPRLKGDVHAQGVEMAELRRGPGARRDMPIITQMKAHRWNSLAFGLIVAVMVHLGVAADAGRLDEPWPVLLSSEPGSLEPDFAALHQRANGSLERIVRAAHAVELQP
jgi:hypothetical protein